MMRDAWIGARRCKLMEGVYGYLVLAEVGVLAPDKYETGSGSDRVATGLTLRQNFCRRRTRSRLSREFRSAHPHPVATAPGSVFVQR